MSDRKLTNAAEVVCYIGAHVAGIATSIFWTSRLLAAIRQDFGTEAVSLAALANALGLILLVMLVFLAARKAMTGGSFTSVAEVGTYLFAHLVGLAFATVWLPILVVYTRPMTWAVVGGLNLPVLASSLVIVVLVMFLFFAVRLYLPRLTRVWFEFDGRCSRFDWWVIYQLTLYAVIAALALTLVVMAVSFFGSAYWAMGLGSLGLWEPFMLWPALAAGVKRCHDRDHSGWFLLVSFIPIVGTIWLIVELGFLQGTIGPNRFGPDPVPAPVPQPALTT